MKWLRRLVMKIEYTSEEVKEIIKGYTDVMMGGIPENKDILVSGYGDYTVRITEKEPEADEGVGLEV
jgi:nucleoid DNA-binding protein